MKVRFWYGLYENDILVYVTDWDAPDSESDVLNYLEGDLALNEGNTYEVHQVKVERK